MPTIGERNAARAQRNMDRNAVIQQDNRRNTALQIEDRIRELETRNTVLESRVEAMGNVIARQALAQQQEVQLQLAVSQNPDTVMMDGAVHDNRIQRSDNVSVKKSLGSLVKKITKKIQSRLVTSLSNRVPFVTTIQPWLVKVFGGMKHTDLSTIGQPKRQ